MSLPVYCPVSGDLLARKIVDGRSRLACTNVSCEYIHYHNPVPAAGIVAIRENRLLLVRRAHEPRAGLWCLPAGFMEWEESPQETAIREAEEETGFRVRVNTLFGAYTAHDDPRTNAILILYKVTIIGGELKAGDDALDAKFFRRKDIPTDIAFEVHRIAIEELLREGILD